jgi:hypothetical protein
MEKYGFVYIWYDKKHKRYYVGSHWGHENDGYVCSSTWMMKAYKIRPDDFKRKIIKKIYTSRKELMEEELRYLSMIKDHELKTRYYNLNIKSTGHWTTYPEKVKTISEKISIRTKEAMARPEIRENYLIGLSTRDNKSSDPNVCEKRRVSMIGKNTGKDNSKARKLAIEANTGRPLSDAHKEKIKSTTHFKTINSSKIKCVHCDFEGNMGNVARYHNDKCKRKIL